MLLGFLIRKIFEVLHLQERLFLSSGDRRTPRVISSPSPFNKIQRTDVSHKKFDFASISLHGLGWFSRSCCREDGADHEAGLSNLPLWAEVKYLPLHATQIWTMPFH